MLRGWFCSQRSVDVYDFPLEWLHGGDLGRQSRVEGRRQGGKEARRNVSLIVPTSESPTEIRTHIVNRKTQVEAGRPSIDKAQSNADSTQANTTKRKEEKKKLT